MFQIHIPAKILVAIQFLNDKGLSGGVIAVIAIAVTAVIIVIVVVVMKRLTTHSPPSA